MYDCTHRTCVEVEGARSPINRGINLFSCCAPVRCYYTMRLHSYPPLRF